MTDRHTHGETSPQTPAARRAVLEGRLGMLFAGRYRLRSLLGTGGMSAVYEAVQSPLDRVVALKMMKGALDDAERRALFEREAAIVSKLRHPSNVTLYDFGVVDDGEMYLVMERLQGQTLGEVLAEATDGRLPANRAMSIVHQVCEGLGEAHGLGVVHRDLKPANIVLDRIGDEERAKVIDYGVAIASPQQRKPSGKSSGAGRDVFGTPHYIAPEQIMGRPVDSRADIYALGVVLYECLAGRTPFTSATPAALLIDHVQTAPPPLDEVALDAGLPDELVALVMQMLAKEPTERPADVVEVRVRLERLLGGPRMTPEPAAASAPIDDDAVAAARDRLDALRAESGSVTDIQAALDALLRAKRARRVGGRLHPGLTLGRRYTLGTMVGRGGFATVWSAWDELSDTRVALKVLHHQWAEDRTRRERFFRGARQMASLEHPGVVRVLDPQGRDGQWFFYVLDYIEGGDLNQAVREGRAGGVEIIEQLGVVVEALSEAHRRGVVHRDIKPSNILLDGAGGALLTDFDLVRAIDTTGGTRTGALGTFLFAAPEVLESAKDAGPAADQYGLTMTLVFALNGAELPSWTLRRPDRLIKSLPCGPALKRVLRRGLAFNAAERFPSVADLYAAARDAVIADTRPAADAVTPAEEPVVRAKAAVAGTAHRPPLMLIPAGTFAMGSPNTEEGRFEYEGPQHDVYISQPFLMAATPISLGQYVGLTGHTPVRSKDPALPARKLTWYDALRYCNALSEVEGLAPAYAIERKSAELLVGANGYRLPTEAEWEYACRAGTKSRFWSGDDEPDLERVGWFSKNSNGKMQRVGQKPPNPWGLHDMHGDVFEWCWDWMGEYPREAAVDPFGPTSGTVRVIRGGSCFNDSAFARSAYRIWRAPDARFPSLGFRVVRPVD